MYKLKLFFLLKKGLMGSNQTEIASDFFKISQKSLDSFNYNLFFLKLKQTHPKSSKIDTAFRLK